MAETRRDKRTFFEELERLAYLTDGQEQDDNDNCRITNSKKTERSCPEDVPISRTMSTPAPQPSQNEVSRTSLIADGDDAQKPAVKRAKTMGAISEKKTNTAASKKRRAYASRVIPDQQQILKGLAFYFFPNSDVSPLRRLRIQRAQEYGAVWARSWEEGITHVVVDKGLTYQDVLTFLKIDSIPPSISLVDESYPSECIKFQYILSVTQTRFLVNGTPKPEVEQPQSSAAQSSNGSLQLKPPQKRAKFQTTSQIDSESDTDAVPNPAPQQAHLNTTRTYEEESASEPPPSERDALDDLIHEAKAAKDLPLDPLEPLEAETASAASDDSEASESEQPKKGKTASRQGDQATDAWQQKFICIQKHDKDSNSNNPNSRTIEVLQQMLDYYERTSDHWRVIAYRKAISALRRQPKRVVTKAQALSITGIGPRLADKIEEIVFTNQLRRLEHANSTPEDLIFQEFLRVYGAGILQASRWIAQGYRSLEDLRTKASLTRQQRVGVDHYDDFSQRIPWQEVEAHGEIVRRAVQKVDTGMQVIISGSYRRGAVSSGDVDVLITKPDATIEQIRTMMMDVVVPQLFKQGFLQTSLASTSRSDGSKWHGASTLPGSNVWRRIDLLFVPGAEIGAALIYFTGNDIFNRSMRLLASKKGMRLNQRGLYADVLRGEQRAKLNTGRLLEGRDERRIFELLGVPWRPPEHRIC